MATQLKKVVAPSGGDYTSLEACMHANEQNLVTADKYFDVEISGTWSSSDTTAVTVHNYTTDITRYIKIYTLSGDTARHNGTAYKSGAYKIVGDTDVITLTGGFITVDGLVICLDSRSTWKNGIANINHSDTGTTYVKNCVIYATNPPNHADAGYNSYNSLNTTTYLINNISYGFTPTAWGFFTEGTAYVYNNTAYGNAAGFYRSSGDTTYKNNIAYNNTEDYKTGSGSTNSSSTNNLAKDTTTPEFNTYYDSKTLTFTNTTAGSENFHLVASDTDAIDKGADLSGIFTTDIDGTTRSGTWDIGADEYVSSVTNATITASAIPVKFGVGSVTVTATSASTNATATATAIKASFNASAATITATKNATVTATAIKTSFIIPAVSVSTAGTASITVTAIKTSSVVGSVTVTATKNVSVTATAALSRFVTNSATVSVTSVGTNATITASITQVRFVPGTATVTTTRSVTITATAAQASFIANSATVSIAGAASLIGDQILKQSLITKGLYEQSEIDKTIYLESPLH